MRMLTTILILMISIPVFAPEEKSLCVVQPEEINYYALLIKAVVMVESNGNNMAFNPSEGAVGAFQIRQCRISHYNQLTGSNHALIDCYDYNLSRKVFLYFARGKDYETAARNWNGRWDLTKNYWKQIKSKL